jgi:hypothetical protein
MFVRDVERPRSFYPGSPRDFLPALRPTGCGMKAVAPTIVIPGMEIRRGNQQNSPNLPARAAPTSLPHSRTNALTH